MKTKNPRVPVTVRALVQRINRNLAKDGRALHAARGERARLDVGDFYVIDVSVNGVVKTNVDPEAMGREMGVLQAWERVAN